MKTRRILAIVLTLVMVFSAMSLISAHAEQDPLYASFADGSLLYTVDFRDETITYYDVVANGTKTVSEDGKSVTITHPDTAGSGFFGAILPQYEFPGYVYTLEFWGEVSDPVSVRIGARIVRAADGATYGFFTNKDEYCATAKGIRNGTAQHALDGDNWRYKEGTNNRQYFRVVVDGITGTLTFYAKSSEGNHDYQYMGKYENIPTTGESTDPSCITACMWLWDVGTISMGDFNIYKGNIMPAETETTAEETTAEVTTAEVTTAEVTTAEVTTAEVTTAAGEGETTTNAPAVTTGSTSTKSGCGSSLSLGVVALVAVLGCAVVSKKH